MGTVCLNRTIFTWVSKVIHVCFAFARVLFVKGLKKLAPLSQPIRSKTKGNSGLLAHAFLCFVPANPDLKETNDMEIEKDKCRNSESDNIADMELQRHKSRMTMDGSFQINIMTENISSMNKK